MKSNITLQQLAEYMRNLAYDDFRGKLDGALELFIQRQMMETLDFLEGYGMIRKRQQPI